MADWLMKVLAGGGGPPPEVEAGARLFQPLCIYHWQVSRRCAKAAPLLHCVSSGAQGGLVASLGRGPRGQTASEGHALRLSERLFTAG